mgnify:CR=1 FL=1
MKIMKKRVTRDARTNIINFRGTFANKKKKKTIKCNL